MQTLAWKSACHRAAPLLLIVVVLSTRAPSALADLQAPPRQTETWTPPETSLPRFLISATKTLFEQGLADPRGCDYRSIQVVVGGVWGGQEQKVSTHGWVFPVIDDKKPDYAIAWSGLVYPLAGTGEPADLDADIRALIAAGATKTSLARPAQQRGFSQFAATGEAQAISVNSIQPIKLCLLLRLGRADLAEDLWAEATGLPKRQKLPGEKPRLDFKWYGISYLSLARDLAWYRFDRGLCAHMRGDDALALADVRALDGFAAAVDTKAEEMGFARPDRQVPAGHVAPYMEFLDQLPELREDQERRGRDRAHPLPEIKGEGREPRVARLIRDLDQVAARQWSQPGAVFLGESPIIKELIALDSDAVEPLLKAFRFDDRLTRSVGFHRTFFRSRHILPVREAAYVALQGILKTSHFAPQALDEAGKPVKNVDALANQIEAYWRENRLLPVVERWYRTLADDGAGDSAWIEAAANIIQRRNVRTVAGGGALVMTETAPLAPGEKPAFRGEPLRQNHDPSVTMLMARRVEGMLKTPEGQRFELLAPCRLAGMLGEWDPAGAAPTLRELTRICRERYASPGNARDWPRQSLAASIARFTLFRAQAGDADALREYALWVRTLSPELLEQHALAVLEPLHRHRNDPTLAAAAAWLFGDPQSPWVPLIGRKGTRTILDVNDLIASPMVKVAAFRALLLAGLADRSRAGHAEMGVNQTVTVRIEDGFSTGSSTRQNDPSPPPQGVKVSIRKCDYYAWRLATLPGAPSFNPCWGEARRDAALADIASFLKNLGNK